MGIEVKAHAEKNAEEKILRCFGIKNIKLSSTRESFRKKLRSGELNKKEIEIPVIAANNILKHANHGYTRYAWFTNGND